MDARAPQALPDDAASLRIETLADGARRLVAAGDWSVGGVAEMDPLMRDEGAAGGALEFDTTDAGHFGTAAAWLVVRTRDEVEAAGGTFVHREADGQRKGLVQTIREEREQRAPKPEPAETDGLVAQLGAAVIGAGRDIVQGIFLTGAAVEGPQLKPGMRRGIRIKSLITHLDRIALRAVPVIAVMSFLIGGILAQQTAFQLQDFGEEVLTIPLVGLLLLREIGILLTAIMVAGRSGSAITAEIGAMRMREEIDALKVIGLNPIAVLVLPRLLALMIAVPVLTFLANIAGMAGAIFVGWLTLDLTVASMLDAFRSFVAGSHFFVGFLKAPVMAFAIGIISAMEGLKVSGSAESLGQHVTSAVVRSIFVVILIDGLFAIFFTSIGL